MHFAGRAVGDGFPCFIIAEAGVNHNGDLALAKGLVDAAASAGADAVKFQTFRTDQLVTMTAPKADYQARTTGPGESQFDMLRKLELNREDHLTLMEHCKKRDILFLSTPFDHESADLLGDLDISAFKLPSGEITNLPLLAHIARKGKPMIVSTGMANLADVETALTTITEAGCTDIVLLHCVSSYPTQVHDANLRAMNTLRLAFQRPVGYSDHTEGDTVALAAVAIGASLIEKHLTLDRNLPGPDQQASLEPAGMARLIEGVRNVEAALGDGIKKPAPCEADTARVARKSLVAAQDLAPGTPLSEALIAIKRPGTGLPPSFLSYMYGRVVKVAISKDTPLRLEDFQ